MTSRLLMPRGVPVRAATDHPAPDADGSCEPTTALDWRTDEVQHLAHDPALTGSGTELLRAAHRLVAERVRPVYALDDLQPASVTLRRGRGSCSQRFAVLEAVARAHGIATRSRGLVIDGRFWNPRFPWLRWAVPDEVLLAWPEFRIDGTWVSVSELFGTPGAAATTRPFTNRGSDTLFDAVARAAVDWGTTRTPGACSVCDLSHDVRTDLGTFDARDDLFAAHGQTFCAPARQLLGPVLGRWAAGAH